MEAPDKIYIPKNLAPHLTEEWASHTHGSLDEYIRKGALIEWVREHKCVIEAHGDERDAYLRGEYSILSSLIDKLNSI